MERRSVIQNLPQAFEAIKGMDDKECIDFSSSIELSYYIFCIDRRFIVQRVTISPKYQVVIPRSARESLRLQPGQKMQVIEYEGRIELIPERNIRDLRGFVKGINTEFKREKDRI
mgnify:CR=1 FL=1